MSQMHPQQLMQPAVQQPGSTNIHQSPGQPMNPSIAHNTYILCRLGQETVQEIVAKTNDFFSILKITTTSLPNGSIQSVQSSDDRRSRINDILRAINLSFRRLKHICEKINEGTCDIDFVQPFVESLIPLVDSTDRVEEKKKNPEALKRLTEERNELRDQLKRKNGQIKEIIDMLRDITWDINTMLAMRKP